MVELASIAAVAMASISSDEPANVKVVTTETIIAAPPAKVWDAVRDVYAVDTRLVPGMVTKVERAGDVRTVTFTNGFVVKERIIAVDDRSRRITYSAVGGKATYHVATMQVTANGRDGSKVIWQTRFLPAELEPFISQNMQAGSTVMKAHLETQ